jgi:WD40 repeat protein
MLRLPPIQRNQTITVVALGSTGKWAAGGTSDGTIRIWDLTDARATGKVLAVTGKLNDLRFSVADEYLAVANQDITLFPLQAGAVQRVIRDDHANYGAVRFSADGRSLLTINGKGAVSTIDLTAGVVQPGHCCTSVWGDVDFTPDGKQVVWAGHWPGLWNLRSGTLTSRLTESRQFMAFGPIAWDAGGTVFMGSQDGRVYQWDLETRRLVRTSPAKPGYVHSITAVGDTGWIAFSEASGPVHLWQPETGASRTVPRARTTSNLVFDASRKRTALGTVTGTIEFWDLVEGRLLNTLD